MIVAEGTLRKRASSIDLRPESKIHIKASCNNLDSRWYTYQPLGNIVMNMKFTQLVLGVKEQIKNVVYIQQFRIYYSPYLAFVQEQ